MSETMCCPLDGGSEPSEIYNVTHVRAAKDHLCAECRGQIAKGTRHDLVKAMSDGLWWRARTCQLCVEIRDHFACGQGYLVGEVWQQLEDNFFPDMKAGGPCMAGLSPEAKTRLFERRMKWMEDGR